ncbi:MAG: glycosyltransferase family 2 protein [Salibacteraceae bacterium]
MPKAAEIQNPNKAKPRLAVALLTYNNLDLLEKFLPGLIDTCKMPGVELVVIDNASTDNTPDFLNRYDGDFRVVRVDVNRGFTNGFKVGLSQIDAEFYCLLSSDVEVSDGWIAPVLDLLATDDKIAVVQPKIRSWHDRHMFEYAGASGGFVDKYGYPFCRGRLFYTIEEDNGQYDDVIEIFWASGACFFIKAELYHTSGGLDDDFFAHMEEIDLCWRLKNAGYKVMVCPQSVVYHMGGAVIAYGSREKVFRNHRNNLIMLVKNLPAAEALWLVLLRLIFDALAFVNMIVRQQFSASLGIVQAHWSFFFGLPKWISKRKKVRAFAVRNDKKGVYPKSVVWQYFGLGKKTFSALDWKP